MYADMSSAATQCLAFESCLFTYQLEANRRVQTRLLDTTVVAD